MLELKVPLCFIDLETTGISITHDRIIEIAVIKMMPNGTVLRKVDRINPIIPISDESSLIHGIYDHDVADKPTFKEVATSYIQFFEGADMGGFNILHFDLPLLVEEFLRVEAKFDYSRKKIIDAQKIYHMMEKRDLRSAYRFYCKKEISNAHSAAPDAEASMEVLLAQVERYKDQQVVDSRGRTRGVIQNNVEALHLLTASNVVDLAGRIILNEEGEPIFNFGKHKRKRITDVLKSDLHYYHWIMKGDFPLDTKRRLTEIKLQTKSH